MRTKFGPEECQNLKHALAREWLETNGLGGYASSTIIGANTRGQHGLLVASLKPPVERHVLLSKLEERVVVNGNDSSLSTNLYPGTIYPHGFNIQAEFELRPWPTFRYRTAEFEFERSVALVHGENTLVVTYHNRRSDQPIDLYVRPLLAFREYNALTVQNDVASFAFSHTGETVSLQPYEELPRLYLHGPVQEVYPEGEWYYRITYPVEEGRGLDYEEDLFTPFEMKFQVPAGKTVYLVVSLDRDQPPDAAALLKKERARRKKLAGDVVEADAVRPALVTAADAFIARRGEDHQTVLAGFPWFTDWGRDTMIALPGLTLTTGRHRLAKQILQTFADYCDRGMIPNVFPDLGQTPEYNTVDAALWFVVACWKYWKSSGDTKGAGELLPAMREVVKHYQAGTRYDIRAGSDGLITAGQAGTQLTWMDVKVDGYVPTPRHGKPVEINALWYNALKMLAELEQDVAGDHEAATRLNGQAEGVVQSFNQLFWFTEGNYLFDVVREDLHDPSIRPNQIFAVSLPYSPLPAERQRAVFDVVTEHLLTPYGLRSLSPRHDKYVGQYRGNRWQRDCAYHQGTVWPWLIGPYCDAAVRVNNLGKNRKQAVRELLQPLLDHLEDGGLGQIAEIFDGDSPHRPVGCFAQAWSIAEVLRVYEEYVRGA